MTEPTTQDEPREIDAADRALESLLDGVILELNASILGLSQEETDSIRPWAGPWQAIEKVDRYDRTFDLRSQTCSTDWLQVRMLRWQPSHYSGWATCRVFLSNMNGQLFGRTALPLTVYLNEPTDMPSAVARFPLGWVGEAPSNALMLLSIRRSD